MKVSKRKNHPTLFVLDGSIRLYDDGSILQLHTQITNREWELIVEQTVKYKVFLECLKNIAYPILGEPWDDDDDWFRIQLDVAVSRMRNIDALLVASHDQKQIAAVYSEKMRQNAKEVQDLVVQMRIQKKEALKQKLNSNGDDTITISNL